MTDVLDLDALDPPGKPDFKRIGRARVPVVVDAITGKQVRYRRTSSIGKALDDDANLWDWKLRTAIYGAAFRPELMAKASTLDFEQNKKELRDIVEDCIVTGKGDARKIQGEAVHSMFDHVDLKHEWTPAPNFRPLVDAYLEVLAAYGLEAIDVEVQCVNDKWHLAGTLDRRYLTKRALTAPDGTIIPVGSVIIGDTKTGRTLEYVSGTYSTQCAGYVDSVRYNVLTDERSAFDPPNYPHWAIIVHAVPEDETVEVHWVDVEAGREGLALAAQVYDWRRRTDLLTPAVPPFRLAAVPAVVPSEPSSEAEPAPVARPGREAFRAALKARTLAVKEHSSVAFKELQRAWPVGMPPLSQDGQSDEQLAQVHDALAVVEQAWAIQHRPFLLMKWAMLLGRDSPLIEPLRHLANSDAAKWDDEALEQVLTGTLRALGHESLATLPDREITNMLSAVFAIQAGTAMLMFDDEGLPIMRFNVKEAR